MKIESYYFTNYILRIYGKSSNKGLYYRAIIEKGGNVKKNVEIDFSELYDQLIGDEYFKLNKCLADIKTIHKKIIDNKFSFSDFKVGFTGHLRLFIEKDRVIYRDFVSNVILEWIDSVEEKHYECHAISKDDLSIDEMMSLCTNTEKWWENKSEINSFADLQFDRIRFSAQAAAILTHEVWGHGLEPDSLDKHSIEKINSKYLIFDDPTLDTSGYMEFDDEGIFLKKRNLVENGYINYSNVKQIRNVVSRNGKMCLRRCSNTCMDLSCEITSDNTKYDYINIRSVFGAKTNGINVTLICSGEIYTKKDIYVFINRKIVISLKEIYRAEIMKLSAVKKFSFLSGCKKYNQDMLGIGVCSPEIELYINADFLAK